MQHFLVLQKLKDMSFVFLNQQKLQELIRHIVLDVANESESELFQKAAADKKRLLG